MIFIVKYIYEGWGFTADMHSNDSAKIVAQLSIYENILTVDGISVLVVGLGSKA